MKKKGLRRVALGVGGIILLAIIVWQLWGLSPSAKPLSEADAKKIATERYSGEIVDITLVKDVYRVIFKLEDKTYDLRIDRSTGDVIEIIRTISDEELKKEKQEASVKEISEAEIKKIIEKQKKGKIKKLDRREDKDQVFYDAVLEDSEKKTVMILNALTGEVVDTKEKKLTPAKEVTTKLTEAEAVKIALETVSGTVDDIDFENEDGLFYYLIEIEQNDEREAEIQINAMTGKVMNISWDE
ncbi:PepSY domain-containing protein [Bacillus sp. FSL K6-3431]|uniref:PepSY domain-containing protein n=1 Tax=Bacillus sp. FSL K6-3431 TaxID=2921500 RepID=UPI0030F93DB1